MRRAALFIASLFVAVGHSSAGVITTDMTLQLGSIVDNLGYTGSSIFPINPEPTDTVSGSANVTFQWDDVTAELQTVTFNSLAVNFPGRSRVFINSFSVFSSTGSFGLTYPSLTVGAASNDPINVSLGSQLDLVFPIGTVSYTSNGDLASGSGNAVIGDLFGTYFFSVITQDIGGGLTEIEIDGSFGAPNFQIASTPANASIFGGFSLQTVVQTAAIPEAGSLTLLSIVAVTISGLTTFRSRRRSRR